MTVRELPTGTVTFLFSDIEGSTRLVQEVGPVVFTEVLERHNAVLREAFGRHGGIERGTQGDSFLVLFRDAPSAVSAAAEAQRALAGVAWPLPQPVRVRMGLHTGVGALGGDDYVGVDVHRAARIAALAHGGQVLLSDATRALVEDGLPSGVTTRSLGEHRLRDLGRPEHLHQLVVAGLASDFPEIRTGQIAHGNLPVPLTSFIGREPELAEAGALLAGHRLVTLTGPGGTGKTRLAIELARAQSDHFDDGAWFVPLEPIRDPELVPGAIAAVFALLESPGSTPLERITTFLAERSVLLVLDNFEQVIDAGPMIADLLRAAPRLSLLVTSRAPLRLSMEQEVAVRPLTMPEADAAESARDADAVRLFVERAGRTRPGFEPEAADLPAVVEICRRLDGLPLGIELAAARIGLLSAPTIAARLARHLDLPGVGTRDLPERQRTLETTIGWSHDLLELRERRLLARLSVFAGGARLEEIEEVAGAALEGGVEAIDGLSVLVDQSLVQAVQGLTGPRFRLLETIRMFAGARLAESGEADAIRARHADAYLAIVEEAAGHMPGTGQVPWLDRLAAEHGNTSAALDRAIETGDVETAHRFVAALWRYWQFRGRISEGWATTSRVLAMPGGDVPTVWRSRAHEAAGGLRWWAGDPAGADAAYAAQLRVARAAGDPKATADALFNLMHTRFKPDAADVSQVIGLQEEARTIYRSLGDERSLARLEWIMGYVHMAAGDFERAAQVVHASFDRFERNGDDFYVALSATALAGIAVAQGNLAEAFGRGLRSLQLQIRMGDTASATLAMRSGALLLILAGKPEAAAVTMGAYQAHSRRHGYRPPLDVEGWMRVGFTGGELDAALAGPELADARARGAAMSLEEVLAFLEEIWTSGELPSTMTRGPVPEQQPG